MVSDTFHDNVGYIATRRCGLITNVRISGTWDCIESYAYPTGRINRHRTTPAMDTDFANAVVADAVIYAGSGQPAQQ